VPTTPESELQHRIGCTANDERGPVSAEIGHRQRHQLRKAIRQVCTRSSVCRGLAGNPAVDNRCRRCRRVRINRSQSCGSDGSSTVLRLFALVQCESALRCRPTSGAGCATCCRPAAPPSGHRRPKSANSRVTASPSSSEQIEYPQRCEQVVNRVVTSARVVRRFLPRLGTGVEAGGDGSPLPRAEIGKNDATRWLPFSHGVPVQSRRPRRPRGADRARTSKPQAGVSVRSLDSSGPGCTCPLRRCRRYPSLDAEIEERSDDDAESLDAKMHGLLDRAVGPANTASSRQELFHKISTRSCPTRRASSAPCPTAPRPRLLNVYAHPCGN